MMGFEHFGWPQWIWIGVVAFVAVSSMVMHGKPQSAGNHDFFRAVVLMALESGLLWWGGFFG